MELVQINVTWQGMILYGFLPTELLYSGTPLSEHMDANQMQVIQPVNSTEANGQNVDQFLLSWLIPANIQPVCTRLLI